MKILALDFGLKRIGVALGESEIGVAATRNFIANDEKTLRNLRELAETEKVKKILLGIPKGLREETSQTQATLAFAKKLGDLKIPIEKVDERFTSKIASQNLQEAENNSRKQKNLVDSESARIMLQEYFDKN